MVHLPIDLLRPNDAIRYLQDRVAKEGQHAGDETAAGKLAEELGYLPLALEQLNPNNEMDDPYASQRSCGTRCRKD